MEWPVCYKDDLILGNANSNTAICTLWTKRDLLCNLPKDKFSLIGNLYSTYGINPILRNLSANPRTRYIIVCGADLIHTGDILLNFISQGVDENYKVKGVEAYVDKSFPKETLEELRKNVKMIDFRSEKNIDELRSKISSKLSEVSRDEDAYMKPVLVEEVVTKVRQHMPVEDAAFRVDGPSISSVWLKALDNILKFGETKDTEYNIKEREILDLISVIKSDEPTLPGWLPIKQATLNDYCNNFFTKDKPLGVDYTYGERLFNFRLMKSGPSKAVIQKMQDESSMILDQIDSAMRKLREHSYSRRAIAITWMHETDSEASNPPCLIEVWWCIKYGKLYQTATFRSHDIYGAWLLNAYALRRLQKGMAGWLGVEVGDLIIISMSAHIYENKLASADELVEKQYRHKEVLFEDDPRGFFVINIENGEIVVRHRVGDGRESGYKFGGKKAQRIYCAIINENLISKMDHAAYIGHELARAEACLQNGMKYVQDEA